jgi:hypothetical protein
VHPDIAHEERRVARGYTAVLLGLLALNFVCTALSTYDVFIELQSSLSLYGYLAVIVLPVSLFWTLIVFSILRFLIQIGHDDNSDLWTRLRRILTMLPAWCLLPLLGFMASAPLQVRALSDDIRLNSVMVHWERLSADLINIQLAQARLKVLNQHECVTSLMRPDVVVVPTQSIVKAIECRAKVEAGSADPSTQAYSLRLLDAIHREIRDDGLIARSSLAFEAAPGTSWLIALLMMSLYSAPILVRMLARKRAYEYFQDDRARVDLMKVAGIELYAHEAFDQSGKSVPLHRYRSVETQQRLVQADYEAQKTALLKQLSRRSEAVHRSL